MWRKEGGRKRKRGEEGGGEGWRGCKRGKFFILAIAFLGFI
jgi:hypothetical protein